MIGIKFMNPVYLALSINFLFIGCLGASPKLNIPDPYIITLKQNEATPLSVTCKADSDIQWNTHIPSDIYVTSTKKPSSDGAPYISTFTVDELYTADTGFLMCIDASGKISSSYIYVYNETGYYFVRPFHHSPQEIREDSTNVSLDCATTNPNLEVTFFKDEKLIPDDQVSFDPKYGVEITGYHNFMGVYECETGGEVNSFHVNYQVEKDVHSPHIREFENSFFVVGEPFFLECSVPNDDPDLVLTWDFPEHFFAKEKKFEIEEGVEGPDNSTLLSTLTVEEAQLADSANYSCIARLRNKQKTHSKFIEIKESMGSFLEITPKGSNEITLDEGQTCTWVSTVIGYPPNITYSIEGPKYRNISPEKVSRQTTTNIATEMIRQTGIFILKIQNIQASDYGTYTLKASNGLVNSSESFLLIVKSRPEIHFDSSLYHYPIDHKQINMTVPILSHSNVNASWTYFFGCAKGINSVPQQCSHNYSKLETTLKNPPLKSNRWLSQVAFNTTEPGIVYIEAFNSIGNSSGWTHFVLNDSNGEFFFNIECEAGNNKVKSLADFVEVVEEDDITIRCGGLAYLYQKIQLTADPPETYTDSPIEDCSTSLYEGECMKIKNITLSHNGSFTCSVSSWRTSVSLQMEADLAVFGKMAPILQESSNFTYEGSVVRVKAAQSFFLTCNVSGRPSPKIQWRKDEKDIMEISNFFERGVILRNHTKLEINYAKPKHAGVYECLAESRAGRMVSSVEVSIKGRGLNNGEKAMIILAIMLLCCLLSALGYMYSKMKKERTLRLEFRRNQLYLFAKGNIDELNPDCTIDEQADLLPYDESFEIERDRIKLGRLLGSGAFGRVMFGEVDSLEYEGSKSKAAVKMCKDSADPAHLRALTLELKIMLHIGRHLNIVNLIGAHTVNLTKGELWILVEFCQYGQLLQFILKHKSKFLNQVNPDTGLLDFSVLNPISPSIFSTDITGRRMTGMTSDSSEGTYYDQPSNLPVGTRKISTTSSTNLEPPTVGTTSPQRCHFDNPQYRPLAQHPNRESQKSYNSSTLQGKRRNPSTVSDSGFSGGTKRALDSQGSYFNFEDVIPGLNEPFNTMTCITWAWQVAIGMDYLSSRKVLHADLAARNLLLAKNNVVKISDFGLSRDMYKKDLYVKKEGDVLPIKWMSLEAIQRRQFSTQSDVWAYGITIWEIFTLGKTPYPGVPINNDFVLELEDGMRLPKPKYATQELYDLMYQCWMEEPEERPSFSHIAAILENMLNPDARENYMAMNDIHQRHNEEYFGNKTDYLEMVSSPDFYQLQSPDPESLQALTSQMSENASEADYLPMGSNIFSPPESGTIFSPRPDLENESKFHFPLSLKEYLDTDHKKPDNETDEPHYKVMTSSLIDHQTPVEVTNHRQGEEEPNYGNIQTQLSNTGSENSAPTPSSRSAPRNGSPEKEKLYLNLDVQGLSGEPCDKGVDDEIEEEKEEDERLIQPLYTNLDRVESKAKTQEIKQGGEEEQNEESSSEPVYKNLEEIKK